MGINKYLKLCTCIITTSVSDHLRTIIQSFIVRPLFREGVALDRAEYVSVFLWGWVEGHVCPLQSMPLSLGLKLC